jgi:hypothetical protein
VIDLFLVSVRDSKYYFPETEYTLTSGSFGSFNIEVLNTSGQEKYISVNGQTIPSGGGKPNTSTPLSAGGGTTPPPIIYGDPPQPLHYEIEVISNGVLNPSQAYGSNKATIGNAQLTITNGKPNTTYQVQISFTSTKEDGSFALRSGNNGSSYSIPYTLLFGTQEVQPGTLYPWTPLQNGQNTRALQITEIIQSTVQAAPSGQFEDTIRVEVVTPD